MEIWGVFKHPNQPLERTKLYWRVVGATILPQGEEVGDRVYATGNLQEYSHAESKIKDRVHRRRVTGVNTLHETVGL